MKVTDLIKNQNKPFYSIEITPPLKIKSIQSIFNTIERIMPYDPKFINITYHQQAISLEEIDGIPTKVIYQKHASTVGVCSAIKYHFNIEVVPHFICGGFNKIDTEDALFDLMFLGLDNILALRGDPRKGQDHFTSELMGHSNAGSLVRQIKAMNESQYIHTLCPDEPIDFCVGVAGYPEKHHEADTLDEDIKFLKEKVDAGADYIVTQMFFDFDLFVTWVNKCREAGITVPIIPGLKPITKKKQVRRLAQNFHLHMPDDLVQKMDNSVGANDAYEIGIEFMADLCINLINFGVPGLHFFTMGNGEDVAEVLKRLNNKLYKEV